MNDGVNISEGQKATGDKDDGKYYGFINNLPLKDLYDLMEKQKLHKNFVEECYISTEEKK